MPFYIFRPGNDEVLKEYRAGLVADEGKAQESFDKAVLSLSGGALGISFAFVDKFVGFGSPICPRILFFAWFCWSFSLASILCSHFFSQRAFCKAIKQFDENKLDKELPGGLWSKTTYACNIAGGSLFIIGVLLMVLFVSYNFGGGK